MCYADEIIIWDITHHTNHILERDISRLISTPSIEGEVWELGNYAPIPMNCSTMGHFQRDIRGEGKDNIGCYNMYGRNAIHWDWSHSYSKTHNSPGCSNRIGTDPAYKLYKMGYRTR